MTEEAFHSFLCDTPPYLCSSALLQLLSVVQVWLEGWEGGGVAELALKHPLRPPPHPKWMFFVQPSPAEPLFSSLGGRRSRGKTALPPPPLSSRGHGAPRATLLHTNDRP